MNSVAFVLLAVLTLGAALAAAVLTRLIHAALMLVLSFLGLAAFYFLLGAEFVGLVQVFVYVGDVAILIVFTILLTRRESENFRGPAGWGIALALMVFGGLGWAILHSNSLAVTAPAIQPLTVKAIGEVLMTNYVWAFLCVGVVLTVALLGALILAMEEKR